VWPLRADDVLANGGERDCDLLHVSIDVTVDFEGRRVYGSATSWVRALLDGTEVVHVHAVGLELREVRDSRDRPLRFTVEEPWVRIELAEPLSRGEEERLRVDYTCRPTSGMFFREGSKYSAGFAPEVWTQGQLEDNRHWLPIWDLPNDRATVDLRVRVGQGMSVVSNGELLGVEEHGGDERTFHWRMRHEIPTYLIALAAGRFEVYADEAGEVPLRYLVGPGTGEERARATFGETPAMLAFFSELLASPFPYDKYDQVVVSEFTSAGMENASATFLADHVLGDAGELADLDGDPRLLLAHELAHQWFGDLVTCLGWSHLWLNEAWASYLELCYERHVRDEDGYLLWLERYRERYLATREETSWPVALDWFSQGSSPERANHVYDKGPWILHMLERELGSDAFWLAARAYLARHANGLVTTADFARAIFDATGRNVEGFLEQWVFAAGHPVLDVSVESATSERVVLAVRQVQEFGPRVPLFDLPLEVEVHHADGRARTHRLRVREAEQRFVLPVEGEPTDVVIDPRAGVLCELEVHKPLPMFLAQGRRAGAPAAQWRALPVLRAAAPRSHEALLVLLRVLRESPQPLLRQRAARLADLDDPRAHQVLLEALLLDPAPRVRSEAVHTLLQAQARGKFQPNGEHYAALVRALQIDSSPAVQRELRLLLQLEPLEAGLEVGS